MPPFLQPSFTLHPTLERLKYREETSHFGARALVTTDKLAKPVGPVWNTEAGNARLGDLGRAERTGH